MWPGSDDPGAWCCEEWCYGGEVRTYKPFYLSSETVLPIECNRSTYQLKPFYLSSETVLLIK
jgi:hypothetical protein